MNLQRRQAVAASHELCAQRSGLRCCSRVPRVAQNLPVLTHNAHADLVGAALYAQGDFQLALRRREAVWSLAAAVLAGQLSASTSVCNANNASRLTSLDGGMLAIEWKLLLPGVISSSYSFASIALDVTTASPAWQPTEMHPSKLCLGGATYARFTCAILCWSQSCCTLHLLMPFLSFHCTTRARCVQNGHRQARQGSRQSTTCCRPGCVGCEGHAATFQTV